jgi:phospholipid-binding lipoprotein MlaA
MSVVGFNHKVRGLRAVLVAAAVLGLGACAPQTTPDEIAHVQETNDPYEPLNRAIFAFNEGLDVVILKPAAVWYTFFVPFQDARDTIRRVIDNASLPWTAINEVFQGEWHRAGTSTTRFLINTTLGIGGMIDWATRWGYEQHNEDFGLTLARRFGVREGPYIVLPVFGPRNVRDAVGLGVDAVGDPVGWILPFPGGLVRSGVDGIDTRSRHIDDIEALRRDSVDFYATLRSITRQRRQAEVDRGQGGGTQDIPRPTSDMNPIAPPTVATPPQPPARRVPGRPVAQSPAQQPPARPTAQAPAQQAPMQTSQPLVQPDQTAAAVAVAPASAPLPLQTATAPWLQPQAAPSAAPRAAASAPVRVRADGSWLVEPSSASGSGAGVPTQGR